MSARRPSRLALAVFDYFVSDNDPLRGDLTEEFFVRRSQRWLWWQVICAIAVRPRRVKNSAGDMPFSVLAVAMLVLMAFEAVFFTNAIHRAFFGPPVQDITGYAYLAPLWFHSGTTLSVQPSVAWAWIPPVASATGALPLGWWIARVRERHRVLALAAFGVIVTLCAAANLQSSLAAQFATSLAFILGLLVGGTLEAAVSPHSQL